MSIGCIGLFLFSNILNCSCCAIESNYINQNSKTIFLNDLEADLKIRKPGGDWEDQGVIASVGLTLDFKINVNINREYVLVGILVKLPTIDDSPIFNYIEGSCWPMPIFPIGEWSANDTDVSWAWFVVGPSWSKEMTFKAKIRTTGTSIIELTVIALKDVNGEYDKVTDSIFVTAEKSKNINFSNSLFSKIYFLLNNIAFLNKFTSIYL